MGLSLPLDQFDVSVHPEVPAKLLNVVNDPQEAARWTMIQVDPAPGYSGSVIAEGRFLSLKLWEWLPQISLNQAYENKFPRSGS
jgi:4'-phosphopantetheinyl transferase